MRKFLTIISLLVFAAGVIFSIPAMELLKEQYRNMQTTINSLSEEMTKLTEIESELEEYKQKYSSLDFKSNYDLAVAVVSFDGVKLESISALALEDGEYFECAEVSIVEDVTFFNEETKKLLFKFKLENTTDFLASLRKSAIVAEELVIDEKEKTVSFMVNSLFATSSEAVESENSEEVSEKEANLIRDALDVISSSENEVDGPVKVEGLEG